MRPLARPLFNATLVSVFGAVALFLSAVGLYAVMAAFVRLQRRDIGVRMALGATRRSVRRRVFWQGLQLAGLGTALGLGIALTSAGSLRALLFGITPLDPLAFAVATLAVAACASLACLLPAVRAARVDPAALLRD